MLRDDDNGNEFYRLYVWRDVSLAGCVHGIGAVL